MFKINISEKSGKTFHLETEAEALLEKSLNDKVQGKNISSDLEGYEFEITGTSDNAGFTSMKNVEGIGLKRVLLTYGKAMKKRPRKEGKKKLSNKKPKGLRLRKTVRGKIISPAIVQINLKVLKEGTKKLPEIFPEQCKEKIEEKKEKVKPEEKPVEKSQPQDNSNVKGDTGENSVQKGGALNVTKETKPEDAESKEEGAQEKEKKEEKELAQPDKELTSEKPEKEK